MFGFPPGGQATRRPRGRVMKTASGLATEAVLWFAAYAQHQDGKPRLKAYARMHLIGGSIGPSPHSLR